MLPKSALIKRVRPEIKRCYLWDVTLSRQFSKHVTELLGRCLGKSMFGVMLTNFSYVRVNGGTWKITLEWHKMSPSWYRVTDPITQRDRHLLLIVRSRRAYG
jgi:hypothetical protein